MLILNLDMEIIFFLCSSFKITYKVHFQQKKFAVDKLHIQGHKEDICLKTYHPHKYKELEKANTVVCEQINFRIGRFKYIMRHMNAERFNFFLYILLNEMNRIHSEGRHQLYNGKTPTAHYYNNKRFCKCNR